MSAEDKHIKGEIAYNSEDQVKYEKKVEEINADFGKIIEESDCIKKSLPQKQGLLGSQKEELQTLKA